MRDTLGTPVPRGAARALACPSCGAAVALRAMAWTQTVACASCGAVLDAADPNLAVLQAADRARAQFEPRVPLGSRGTWQGVEYEAVGVQERAIRADGAEYAWREYVLFNPYHGFRYLTEYDGHWTFVAPLAALPVPASAGGRPAVRVDGTVYRHFQTAAARTRRVLGEFPWEARAGDVVATRDYIAPPYVLSAEEDAGAEGGAAEVTWSRGEYVEGRDVWQAFNLPGNPPYRHGVYANQPSPYPGAGAMLRLFALLALVLLLGTCARVGTAARAVAFQQTYRYTPPADASDTAAAAAFVTPAFTLGPGRFGLPANAQVETEADVEQRWMAVDYALIDEATGQTYESGAEVGHYTGVEDGERWSEGSRRATSRFGLVPPGRYFLRVAPSGGDPGQGASPIAWTLTVRRDVPSSAPFWLALVALALPPLFAWLRAASFETRRWAESDYAPSTSSSDDDEE